VKEPSLFDQIDEAAEAAVDARAEADVAAGRVIPHSEMVAWLTSWGTTDEMPAPRHWLEKDTPSDRG